MTKSVSFSFLALLTARIVSASGLIAGEMRPMMTLETAKMAADACEAYQTETELPKLNIAVVDRGADLVLFRRQDDAFLCSGTISIERLCQL